MKQSQIYSPRKRLTDLRIFAILNCKIAYQEEPTEVIIAIAILWPACGLIAAAIAENKGLSGYSFFAVGFLLGPLGIVVALVMPKTQAEIDKDSHRLFRCNVHRCCGGNA